MVTLSEECLCACVRALPSLSQDTTGVFRHAEVRDGGDPSVKGRGGGRADGDEKGKLS